MILFSALALIAVGITTMLITGNAIRTNTKEEDTYINFGMGLIAAVAGTWLFVTVLGGVVQVLS